MLRTVLLASALAVGLVAGSARPADADLLTSFGDYSGPGLDLSAFVGLGYNFTFGPESIPGGITFTSNVIDSNSGQGSVLGQGSYGLSGNGNFGGDAVYAGLDGPEGYMSFIFDTPVAEFGAFMNYATSFSGQTIGAYDLNGLLIEEYLLPSVAPISTPGGFNAFEFRGIDVGAPLIKEFRMSNGYILAAATEDGSPVTPTPEPASLALLGMALAGLGIARRHRRA
jgi:hypothetical protein